MRVVAGAARGRKLKAPLGCRIRPTSDRVKEALFDLLRVEWESCSVLDLFAGTGALGIEALSRGAMSALFVERDPTAIRFLRQNLEACGMVGRARVVVAEAIRFLERGARGSSFEVITADPPYGRGLAPRCLSALHRGGWLARGGVLALEHSRREDMPDRLGNAVRQDFRRYGDTCISLYSIVE
jgi:16S rRNA (guanine966-N2)-methyltransferase